MKRTSPTLDAAPEPGPDAPLATALVGPRVTGLRGALAAVRFYARTPEAEARPRPLDRALWGAGQAVRAVALVADDAALRRAAIVPTLLTFAGCAVVALLALGEDGEGPQALGRFHAFLVAFVAASSMPPTILRGMWVRVAREARRVVGLGLGEDPYAGEPYLRMLLREGAKLVRQAIVVSAGLFPLVVVLRILPFGAYESALLAAAWAFYWIVVDAFELPIEVVPGAPPPAPPPWYARLLVRAGSAAFLLGWLRPVGRLVGKLTRPWHEEVAFTERHRWEVAGFALVAGVVLAIPGVGLFFRSVAITAATALHGRLEERGRGRPR